MLKIKHLILIVLVVLGLSSCVVLQQMAQVANFANCDFKFASVTDVQMLGININKNMTRSDLTIGQVLLLTNSLMNRTLPVSFNVNLDVTNPNNSPASMVKMDYILSLNTREVLNTSSNNSISVPANGSNIVSIPVSIDLFQVFTGETADAVANLAFKLAGANSDPVNVEVKVKPYITVGDQQLAYHDYITLNKVLQ